MIVRPARPLLGSAAVLAIGFVSEMVTLLGGIVASAASQARARPRPKIWNAPLAGHVSPIAQRRWAATTRSGG